MTPDQKLEAMEREVSATEMVLSVANKRVNEPSPDDDFEAAHRDLRRAAWEHKIAVANHAAALAEKQRADIAEKRAELARCLTVASIAHLRDASDDARAHLVRARVQARASLKTILELSEARDAAAERAIALAAELGEPVPEVWSRVGVGPIAAMMLDALSDAEPMPYQRVPIGAGQETLAPLDVNAFWRVVPDRQQRSYDIARCFGGVTAMAGQTGLSPEELADRLLREGTDPRTSYGEKVDQKSRAGDDRFERFRQWMRDKFNRDREDAYAGREAKQESFPG